LAILVLSEGADQQMTTHITFRETTSAITVLLPKATVHKLDGLELWNFDPTREQLVGALLEWHSITDRALNAPDGVMPEPTEVLELGDMADLVEVVLELHDYHIEWLDALAGERSRSATLVDILERQFLAAVFDDVSVLARIDPGHPLADEILSAAAAAQDGLPARGGNPDSWAHRSFEALYAAERWLFHRAHGDLLVGGSDG